MFERLKKSLFSAVEKISKTELKGKKLEKVLFNFKLSLLENDVALSVAENICNHLKIRLKGIEVNRFRDQESAIKNILRETLIKTLQTEKISLLKIVAEKRKEKEPFTIIFFGINGSGKTTSIAKIARLMLNNGYSVVLACSDTYRAGSIEQLEEHAKRLGVRMIKHSYGADPAAVAYDAVSYANAKGVDVVLIDTAGRMEMNKNLMMELAKIKRVIKPDLSVLVVDALTGNDAVLQAEEFDKAVGIDATILTKVDADAKGGSCFSVTSVTGKPIIYLGNGQRYEDLIEFEPEKIVEKMMT